MWTQSEESSFDALSFLPVEHSPRSPKEKELVASKVRSHAARVGHVRRRRKANDEEGLTSISPRNSSRTGHSGESVPAPAVSSICSPIISLDRQMHRVLTYFTTQWMPSPDNLPAHCHIAGLTPVRLGDDTVGQEMVRSTFQTADETSLYALLAVSARRMRAVSGKDDQKADLSDTYSLRAIHALRKAVDDGTKVSAGTVLAMSFLLLSEFLALSPAAECEQYRLMLRSLVVSYGGLQALPVSVAQFAIAFDSLTALAFLTEPAIDPFAYPDLLPTCRDLDLSQNSARGLSGGRMPDVDERIQILSIEAHNLTLLVKLVRTLPDEAWEQTRQYIGRHKDKVYGIICEPLQRSSPGKYTESTPQTTTADILYFQIRNSTWRRWVIYCASSFVTDVEAKQRTTVDPLCIWSGQRETREMIGLIQQMLRQSGWMMPHTVLLWIVAVNYLTCSQPAVQKRYQELLRIEAYELRISSISLLRQALRSYFPLQPINAEYDTVLWAAIKGPAR